MQSEGGTGHCSCSLGALRLISTAPEIRVNICEISTNSTPTHQLVQEEVAGQNWTQTLLLARQQEERTLVPLETEKDGQMVHKEEQTQVREVQQHPGGKREGPAARGQQIQHQRGKEGVRIQEARKKGLVRSWQRGKMVWVQVKMKKQWVQPRLEEPKV